MGAGERERESADCGVERGELLSLSGGRGAADFLFNLLLAGLATEGSDWSRLSLRL